MSAAFNQILEEIVEKTDLMYQSLKVDDVDVFLVALEEREALIDLLEPYKANMARLVKMYEPLISQFEKIDKLIEPEMINCQKRMKKNISEVQLERAKLKQNSVKASRYIAPKHYAQGNYFDNKK